MAHATTEPGPLRVDALIEARWVVPVEPHGCVLERHAVAIDDGRVIAVLPAAEAVAQYLPQERIELPSHVLVPGFVNVHTHAPMVLFRGYADDLPLQQWLEQHIWPAEARWVDSAFVQEGTRLACAEMLKGGTTSFSDMYFFPGDVARSAAEAGMRAVVGLIVLDLPTAWAADADEYFAKGIAVHDSFRHHPLITTAFAPHAPYTVSDASLRRVAILAEELDIPIHMHVHETADEVAKSVAALGMRPLQRLEQLGLLSPRLIAVHMTQVLDAELACLSDFCVHIAHCPESNLKLASGWCPVAKLMAAGVNVALGTDGAASNNDLDMLGEMRTAALLGKGVAGDSAALPATSVLRMATLNGARALALDQRVGSIEAGKEADLAAVDLGRLATQPVYDPVSALVYSATRDQVTDVWVRGRRVVQSGELTTLDEPELLAQAKAWRRRVREADEASSPL